jgi:hypothetical protein
VVNKIVTEANGPERGDRVRLTLNREYMTNSQREMNGMEGTVTIRDPFAYGSDEVRYTVEFDEPVETADGNYQILSNLTADDIEKI